MIGPALEEISDELNGKVVIAKLNIDDHPNAPAKYGVRGIPTMILLKNGEIAETKVGAAPKGAIKGWLEGTLYGPGRRTREGGGLRPPNAPPITTPPTPHATR